MKKLLTTLLFILSVIAVAPAQSKVEGKEIIAKINRGEAISYQNATISGDVDFTQLENRTLRKEDIDSDRNYVSTVKVPVRFVNCTFTDDVFAYYSVESQEETNNADFTEDVVFENCKFEGRSEFKYSRFSKKVSFAKSRFEEEALFKYTRFATAPDFSDVKFESVATFKYTNFKEKVNFANATFNKHADFKYTQFPSGSSFRNTTFSGLADFKYARFSDPDMAGVNFNGSEDFKYTKVDGKSFTTYLLNSRK